MAFSRVKPAGWAFGEILTSSQMNSLDVDHANAIDGAAGGSYTLTNPLSIDGDTVTIETLDVSGDLTVSGDLAVNGNVVLGDDPLLDTLTVEAIASFALSISVGTSATIGGSLFANGQAVFSDDVTLEDVLGYSGSGRILQSGVAAPDSNSSINMLQNRFITLGLQTATRLTTLTGTPVDGDWVVIANPTAFIQTIQGINGGSYPQASKTGYMWLRVSGSFIVVNQWVIP